MYIVQQGNTSMNSRAYKEIIKDFPHMEYILTNMYVSTDYALHNIWDSQERIVFYFNQSMALYFKNQEVIDLLLKYKTSMQVPGNQEYTFSISIDKVETI